jgi:hypothetical protein
MMTTPTSLEALETQALATHLANRDSLIDQLAGPGTETAWDRLQLSLMPFTMALSQLQSLLVNQISTFTVMVS